MIAVDYSIAMIEIAASISARRARLATVVAAVAAFALVPIAALAQSTGRDRPAEALEEGTFGKGPPGSKPQLSQPEAGPLPKDTADKQPLKPKRPTLPETAEQKAKALADLYALLQTAEDEAAATKVTEQIERLWAHSGSDTVNLLIQRSSKAIRDKKKELAQKLLDSAIELAPDYPEVFSQRAFLHFTENNYEAAVGDLRRVLALDPNHYKALEGLAQIWRETGNKKGAYRVMQQLIEVHPHAAGAKQIHDELKKEVDGQGI